jgi:hypothetical protein
VTALMDAPPEPVPPATARLCGGSSLSEDDARNSAPKAFGAKINNALGELDPPLSDDYSSGNSIRSSGPRGMRLFRAIIRAHVFQRSNASS